LQGRRCWPSLDLQGKLAQALNSPPLYNLVYEAGNEFEVKGCRSIAKAHFPKLKVLLFGSSLTKIEFTKCSSEINKELIKGEFPEIKKLKIYDASRYYFYRYYDRIPSHIENKEFWNE
jgi:hypothetical protein